MLVAVVTVLGLAGCGSGTPERTDPFVGQWESTGGDRIAMRVDAPSDGAYPVRITGGNVDLQLSATKGDDGIYRAQPSATTWSFRMVDDSLLTATAAPPDKPAVSTSFKRVGD